MTSQRFAIFLDVMLDRLGTAFLMLVLGVVILALTLGLFPRTLVGTLVLILVGFPVCVLGQALADVAFTRGPRSPVARAGGFIGIIALLALVWWWSASNEAFMRKNFF